MPVGDSDADELLLVSLSEYLLKNPDAARGDGYCSEYIDWLHKWAADRLRQSRP
jgi:hypothetical protein